MDKDKQLNETLKEIYTPLSVAKKEIQKRWKDKKLKRKVEEFLNGDVPEVFKKAPKAVIGRNIVSPNYESFRFLDLAKNINLSPVCLEHLEDKFVAKNRSKYHLCRLLFHNGIGKKGGSKIEAFNIINFKDSEGKFLSKLDTVWGENLVHFHHRISKLFIPQIEFLNISKWLKKKGKKSKDFYKYYLFSITH